MNLKQFHIIFIVASILIAFAFAFWAFVQYNYTSSIGYIVTGVISGICGLCLALYEITFIKKNQSLS